MQPTFTPEHLERWRASSGASAFDSAANYAGADFSEFYLAPIHRTRDTADALTLSNFRVIAAELERLADHDETGVVSIGHWACGWYEIFLIHEIDTAALERADEWAATLSCYPVADESDWSELEYEQEIEAWDSYGCREWRDALVTALETYAPEDSDVYWADETIDRLTEAQLYDAWHSLSEQLSWSVQHESDGPSFNIRGAAELLTAAALSKITGLALLEPEQEWRREPYPWPDGSTDPLVPALA